MLAASSAAARSARIVLFAFVLALFALNALAQATGVVSGRIADRGGASLPGAEVTIPSLGLRTTTNVQGEYTLGGVPAGTHTVEIRYLGHQPASQSVTVEAGQRVALNVAMTSSALAGVAELDSVTVTGLAIRDSAARALNQQRSADGVTNVISSDSIGKFPDPNIAEALQRVPGIAIERDQGEGRYINVRGAPSGFTAVSIDGVTLASPAPDTRAVDLDVIPSDIVSQIEVSKSLRPEQDADSIAGAVNIVTQSPFDTGAFTLRASGGASYNDFGGTSDTRGNFLVSDVFGADERVGALFSASYSRTDRQVDNVENVWDRIDTPEGGEAFGLIETLFKDYDTRRERIAMTGMLDFNLTEVDRLYLRGSYARFEDDEYRNRLGIIWEDGSLLPGATDSSATVATPHINKQWRHRVLRNELTTVTAGAEHDRDRFRLDYNVSYSMAEQSYPNRDELLYRTISGQRPATLSYDFSGNPNLPYYSLFDRNEHLELQRFAFRENTFREQDTEEDELSFAGNVELPATLAGAPTTWKFGVKYRGKEKESDNEQWRNRAGSAAPTSSLPDLLGNEESRNYGYLLGNKFTPGLVQDYLDGAKLTSAVDATRRIPQSITSDYEVTEDLYAAYGQAKMEFGRTDLLFGLRIERTEVKGSAPQFNADTGAVTVGKADSSYTDYFPGITLRHAFSEQLIGRAALTRAIARPDFVDIVPRVSAANTDSALPSITLGNPDLEQTLSNNLDLSLEYYFEPLGLLSAGVFYKDLTDYQYTLTFLGTYEGGPARLSQPQNAPDGSAYGFEFNWSQKFEQLPGWLGGFGVFANYTYTDADMKLGREVAGRSKFPLEGQSENTFNAALFYELGGFNARLSYTSRSDYIDEINADDADLDLFWEGREQLDFTTSYRFNRSFEVFAEVKNLTNSAGLRYRGSKQRPEEYEKFGYSVFLGVKYDY
jgi:TonB-dependent receptor